MDLFTIMESHFQQVIKKAIQVAVHVQLYNINSSQSKYELSCAYYYLFLFSGWWLGGCTNVGLNGKYNPTAAFGFEWFNSVLSYVRPNRSEMKIRRKQ
jgi:hypothetical protein